MSEKPKVPANRRRTGFRGPSPDVGKATQFRPGQSGNPSGRPKTKFLSEAYRRILDDRSADTFAETIANDALHADRARDRLAAVQEITDRTEGRAVQAVKIEAEMDEATARMIADLAERLLP